MSDLKPGHYAVFDTTLGEITCELFPDKAPVTVQNFVGLANGTKEFVDPKPVSAPSGLFTTAWFSTG